jgi:acetyl-CoA carboxylase, biotin carboxylase subunit
VDEGYEQGMDIPIFYDPMIAKLIAYAATRDESIDRLCRAIDEYHIKGIQNTLAFGKWAVNTVPFRSGNFDTKFIEKYYHPSDLAIDAPEAERAAAVLAAYIWERRSKSGAVATQPIANTNNWKVNRK